MGHGYNFHERVYVTDTWQTGIDSDNPYVIRASDTTTCLRVSPNGNSTISGNLDVSVSNARTSVKAYKTMEGYTSFIELEAKWDSQGYLNSESNKPGAHYFFLTVKDDLHMYCGNNLVHIVKDTTIDGNLDVGVGASQTSIKAHVNHAGCICNVQIEARWRSQGFIHANTNYPEGLLLFVAKDALHMYVGIVVYFYKPITHASDDRLKGNEELIDNACETLSKLRPQLYDKKPDMENNDPTTWYKESGLIAQETYYDAPELRHLIHRGKPELDEEGNSILLHEIPTSIDPQQDPHFSSW